MSDRLPLKPCPFCGNQAWEHIEGGALVIWCQRCKGQMARQLVPPSEWEKAVVACREAWNRRTAPPEPPPAGGERTCENCRWKHPEYQDVCTNDALKGNWLSCRDLGNFCGSFAPRVEGR